MTDEAMRAARKRLFEAQLEVSLLELGVHSAEDLDEGKAIGALLKATRRMRDLSIPQLAQRSGVSMGGISKIERGRGKVQRRTMRDLARALKVPESQLDPEWAFAEVPGSKWQKKKDATKQKNKNNTQEVVVSETKK